MKKALVMLAMALCVFLPIAHSQEKGATSGYLAITDASKAQAWILSITDDGQIEINGKAVEKMSDPEIKATMLEFRNYHVKQQQYKSLVDYYDKQTTYLLEELERCQKSNKGGK